MSQSVRPLSSAWFSNINTIIIINIQSCILDSSTITTNTFPSILIFSSWYASSLNRYSIAYWEGEGVSTNKISNFLSIFFSFWAILTNKKIFCTWAKNNLLLYTQRATCPLDPPKWIFRGLLLKLSNKHGLTFFSPWKIGIGTHTSDKGIMPPQKCSSQKMKEE